MGHRGEPGNARLGQDAGAGGMRGLEVGSLLEREAGSSYFPDVSFLAHLRIEEELGDEARFAGHNFRNPSVL